MKRYLIVLFFLACHWASGQEFNIPSIPKDLLEGANAVILKEETEVVVEKLNKMITQRHFVVAVLNKQGEQLFSDYSVYYQKFKKIKKLEAAAYTYGGQLILKSKNSDVRDEAVNPFDNAVTDIRVKTVSLDKKSLSVPYILEFKVEEESSETFFYDDWSPVRFLNTAIVSSKHILKTAAGINYRTREINLTGTSKKSLVNGQTVEIWELVNFKPISYEEYLPPNSRPEVLIQSEDYQIDKYSGKVKSWKDIGDFYTKLNQGRDVLPEITKHKLKTAIGNETDPVKKTQKVYAFMQSHTRYFNISFKLGGWQSLPASLVAEKGYGDCKALTNYTLALLKEAGVKAYPALIAAGYTIEENGTDDFPKNAFNHIIACVPMAKDTLWLECTSQTNPFGYLGSFTGNRKALLIKENNSELVQTKTYRPEDNFLTSVATVTLEADGSAHYAYQSQYGGIQHETVNSLLLNKDTEKQKDWIKRRLKVSDVLFDSFGFEPAKEQAFSVKESARFKIQRLGSLSGERLFFNPQIISSFISNVSEKLEERKDDFYLNPNGYSFLDIDSVTVTIPAGFVLENKPKDLTIEAPFGEFDFKVLVLSSNQFLFLRKVKLQGGKYPKEVYKEWIDFVKAINRADKQRTVLKKTS